MTSYPNSPAQLLIILTCHGYWLPASLVSHNYWTLVKKQACFSFLRFLLVDMDPQASLTSFMGVEPTNLEKTV